MKKFLQGFVPTLLIGAAALWLFYGCRTMTQDEQTMLVQSLSTDAARIGSAVDLAKNPSHRPLYTAVKGALDRMIADGQWDALEFQRALRLLPVGALRGENGALVAQGILSVFSLATGYIDIEKSPPLLAAAMRGVRDGLEITLAEQAVGITASQAPTYRQIELPPR